MLDQLHEEAKSVLLDLCCSIAEKRKIVAACFYGPSASEYADERSSMNVLLVLSRFEPMLKTYRKAISQKDVYVLTVDQRAFRRDVEMGWLGEFASDKLMVPYEPLINSEYLWHQEVTFKKRIIFELLETIILEFPELSRELLIKPEYFMYETLMQRARLFPPITYCYLNMLRSDVKERNVQKMMKGYKQALDELVKEDWLVSKGDHVNVTPKLIRAIKNRKLRIPVVLKSVQRTALLYVVSALPKMLTPLAYDEQLYTQTQRRAAYDEDLPAQLEDPKNYLLMPTRLGLVPLSDKTSIEEFVKKTMPNARISQIETKQIGGVLNSVYLLTLQKDKEQQRVVVKKFRDWVGFKWFPLALWAVGTKSFAVLGQSRLQREYALNQYLQCRGVPVPKIMYISPKQSLIFQEFVEGENLFEVIKRAMAKPESAEKEFQVIKDTGKTIADAHRLGVALGDCKPENIIVAKDGRPFFVDLEQASRDGNKAWDVAEFIYYMGHYVPPLASADSVEFVAKSFIQGYLEAGGKKETVRKAASPRYTKVFSIFTQPHVIVVLSNLCRKMSGQQNLKNRSFAINAVLEKAKRKWARHG